VDDNANCTRVRCGEPCEAILVLVIASGVRNLLHRHLNATGVKRMTLELSAMTDQQRTVVALPDKFVPRFVLQLSDDSRLSDRYNHMR
jgi:hypothetical protein